MIGFTPGKTFVPLNHCGMHSHAGWEIILNQSGYGNNVFDKIQVPFFPGSIVCVPPGMKHCKVTSTTFENIYVCTSDLQLFEGNDVLTASDDEFKSIEKMMELIHYAYFRDEQKISAATSGLLSTLVQMIMERFALPEGNRYAQHIRKRIIQRFTDPEFTVSQATEGLPYCADYLRRLFRTEYGSTPQEYITHLRMEKARRMLEEQHGISVAEVSISCGYYDPHYFSRLFHRMTGKSPQEFADKSSFLST